MKTLKRGKRNQYTPYEINQRNKEEQWDYDSPNSSCSDGTLFI
jgi:hypothetical protein